ncbi:helix-turn-helix domain-containing protein [Streptomyces phaeochromogenes]
MQPGADAGRLRGWLVAALRKDRDIPQQELANEVGCSRSTISTWETRNQRPTPSHLVRLADSLGVHACDLLEQQDGDLTLRGLRISCGLTQIQISALLGISVSTYCDVETGRQTLPARWVPILKSTFNTTEQIVKKSAPRQKRIG